MSYITMEARLDATGCLGWEEKVQGIIGLHLNTHVKATHGADEVGQLQGHRPLSTHLLRK